MVDIKLCSRAFWNDFFSPRFPGVFIILLLVVLHIVYACVMVLMSAYKDNFSFVQHNGYFTLLLANVIVIVTGLLSIHFLTQKPSHMKVSYCIHLHIALLFSILLGFLTPSLMLTKPSPKEVAEHTSKYVRLYHKAPYLMGSLFVEKQCCGVQKFGDIFTKTQNAIIDHKSGDKDKNTTTITYYRIPPSCCRKEIEKGCKKKVTDLVDETEYQSLQATKQLYLEPCLPKGTFDQIEDTATFAEYRNIVALTFLIFVFIFGILAVLNYYIWYKFPRMSQGQRPTKFNENIRSVIRCRCSKLKKSSDDSKKDNAGGGDTALEKKGVSEFTMRHQMIMQSLANMRNNEKEHRHQGQQDRQMAAARSTSSMKFTPSGLQTTSTQSHVPEKSNYLQVPKS